MKILDHFSIPIEGMQNGKHEKTFSIAKPFFNHFEQSLIKEGNFEVKLELDKRSDLIELIFDIAGTFETVCDRCTATVNFPLQTEASLLVKFADEPGEELNVMYITRDTHHINVSKYLYETICLAVPLMKVFDCDRLEKSPCDFTVLDKLDRFSVEPIEDKEDKANPIWEKLKGINFDNK
jgi:uncharacterized metal-binding protein YceD (DUF177 family)